MILSTTVKGLSHQCFAGGVGVIFRVFLVGLTLALSSCGATLGSKSRTEVLPLVTVPGGPLPSALNLALGVSIAQPSIDLGAGENFVTSVRVRNLDLNILDISDTDPLDDGASDSFDFLTGLNVSIRAQIGEETRELMLATLPDGDPQFGSAARNLSLTVVNSQFDVLDFILAPGGYQVVLDLQGQIPPDNVILSGTIRFRVGLGLDF